MKKVILILTVACAIMFTVISCKKENKEDVKKEEVKKEMATTIYQCPMDCEHGKSYTKPGNCPVCKMALKEKKPGKTKKTNAIEATKKHEHKDGHGHEH